jgi:hypothetical protein
MYPHVSLYYWRQCDLVVCSKFRSEESTIEFKFLESSRISDELKHWLKELTNEIAPFLTIIWQKSLNIGDITNDWKTTHHVSIFKKVPKYISENHRPIPLTWICCKLLDHIVVSSRMTHADTYNIHYHWLSYIRSREIQ